MRNRTKQAQWLCLVGGILLYAASAQAQIYIGTSPADLYETQVSFMNPGAIPFQDAQFIFGSRVLNYGFLDNQALGLRQTFVSVSAPEVTRLQFGLGLWGSNFTSPIFSENRLNLTTSAKIGRRMGLGAQFGLLSKAFNRDRFTLIDESDPVFARSTSKYAFNLGLGAYYLARPDLQIGIGLENINRPNISLIGDDVREPLAFNIAANYLYDRFEGGAGFLVVGSKFYPMLTVSTSFQGIGILKTGLVTGNLDFSGQVHVTEKISLDYRYSYPLSEVTSFSNGTHRISISYRFDDIPSVDFDVFATLDTQNIREERLSKNIGDDFTKAELEVYDRTSKILSAKDPINTYYNFVKGDPVDPLPQIDFDVYRAKFDSIIQSIAEKLTADKTLSLRVIASKRKARLAMSFCEYLHQNYDIRASQLEYGHVNYDSTQTTYQNGANGADLNRTSKSLSSESTLFIINPIIKRKYNRVTGIKSWKLVIRNTKGEVVKSFEGVNEPPASIHWDWRTEDGRILEVGRYTYFLEWRDRNNEKRQSSRRFLTVTRFVRDITVDFTKQAHKNESKQHRIDLHLGI